MGRFSKIEVGGGDPGGEAVDRDRDWCALAERCREDGALEPALRYYSRALSVDSKLERAWLGQVLCLVHLGELPEAVAWADRALAIHPESAELTAAKAAALGRLGERERALAVSDGSLKKSEVSALVWWARGDVLIAGNEKTAEYCFQKAGELGKQDWQLLFWIGKSHHSIERALDAKGWYEKARRLAPEAAVVSHHLGLACRDLGLVDEAAQAFRHALSRNPGNVEARSALEKLERIGAVGRAWAKVRAKLSGGRG